VYPAENRGLADQLATKGLIISEFPMASTAFPQNFPIRNRIISGVSVGLLVVEGAQYSGSAITARLALDQGREVFAVPGNITSKMSWGPNLLIKQGAKLVQDWNDVVVDLPPEVQRRLIDAGKNRLLLQGLSATDATSEGIQASLLSSQSEICRKLLNLLRPDVSTHLDNLLETLEDFPPAELIAALFELEMTGLVKQLPGKNFVKVW
jgi:DNA processing protein